MRRMILRRFAASATPRERRFPQSLLPAFFAQTTQQTRLAKALAAEEELLITSTTKARVDRLAPEIVIPQIPHPVKISTVAVDPPRVETASPIVVAHGFGAGKGVFFRNLETLAVDARRRVLAFDWLGQGCSDRPGGFPARPTPLARAEAASDDQIADGAVAWFTDSLEAWRRRVLPAGAPFTLVAHSVGGFLAAHYALRHPGAVDKLVLVSPAGVPRHPEGLDDDAVDAALAAAARPRYACFSFGRPLVALWDYHVTPQSLIRLLGDQSRRARPVVKHLYRRAGDVPDAFADYLYNINALPGSSERVLTTLFKPADRDDALRGIYARRALVDDPRAPSLPPTTVLYGERDWMLNGLTERAVADLGAELVLVPDAGHQIHLENPEACNAAILAAVGSGAAREARVG